MELAFMPQKAALMFKKLIDAAVANAKQGDASFDEERCVVDRVTVDKGTTYVRFMPRAFGRATPINRESSHVTLTLAVKSAPIAATTAKRVATAPAKKSAKKPVTATKKK
jgi:large subunit ribosomal protein L22